MSLQPRNLPLRTGALYRHAPRKAAGKAKATALYWVHSKTAFAKQADMTEYLDAVTLPASGRWAYGRIPKTGTNTVLALLHYLEFGVEITTQIADPANASADTAPHRLADAGVFMPVLRTTHAPAVLDSAFRFTLLRHPVRRTLSSFAYLCRSHDLATSQLAPVRLRLTAMTGFDWTRDPHTQTGLLKFLDFVEESLATTRLRLDRHMAPQSAALPRKIFAPHLTGRLEEMPAFASRLAALFGTQSVPDHLTQTPRNATTHAPLTVDAPAQSRIETLFADDFNWYEEASP